MQVLRNKKTLEVYPLNGDMQLHEDIEVVDIPSMDRVTLRRGVAVLEETGAEKPKRRGRPPKSETVATDAVAVESAPETPDDVGESGGDDAS